MAVARASGGATAARTGVRVAAGPALAAALSASSAGAHLAVMAPHWSEWWAHGAFFLACAVTQALLAVLVLWRPWSWVLLTGIAGNLAIVTMYVYSRTNGAPVGPHEGVPEPPGALDLTTTAGELMLVALLVAMVPEAQRRWAMRLVLLVGLALWTARATGIVV
jgi:hypothetical protein